MTTEFSLTPQFHHDRGLVVFADSPRRGEYGPLGRRLRRGQQFDAIEIAANIFQANQNSESTIVPPTRYATIPLKDVYNAKN